MAMKKKVAICQYDANFWKFNTHESRFQCYPMIVYVPWKSEYKKKSSLILIRTEIEMIQ